MNQMKSIIVIRGGRERQSFKKLAFPSLKSIPSIVNTTGSKSLSQGIKIIPSYISMSPIES